MGKPTEEQVRAYCEAHGYDRTGVFATDEEIEQSRKWAAEFADAPVVKIAGRWLHEDAEETFKRRIDGLAAAHGLPGRGEDHYGLIASGEFVTARPT